MTALVTNAKSRIAYNIVRNLGKHNIDVFTSDFIKNAMSFYSRYSKKYFIYPSPFSKQNEFIEHLKKILKKEKPDVLLPVFEETFLIAKYKSEISNYVNLVLDDYEKLLLLHNKNEWQKLTQKLDVRTPKTFEVTRYIRSPKIGKQLNFPVLVKPKQGGGGWATYEIKNLNHLEKLTKNFNNNGLPWDRFLLQEKIKGKTHCVAMLFRKGELKAKVGYVQMREYPIEMGQATYRTGNLNEESEKNLQKILEHIKWHGVCQADFIIDSNTNESFMIDINPRFWGSISQAIASGVDFPLLTYKLAIEGDIKPVLKYNVNASSKWIGGDIRVLLSILNKKKKIRPLIKEFLSLKNFTMYFDDLSLDDPMPFVKWTTDIINRMLKSRSFDPKVHDALNGIWK